VVPASISRAIFGCSSLATIAALHGTSEHFVGVSPALQHLDGDVFLEGLVSAAGE
jgi:hypothetical protein